MPFVRIRPSEHFLPYRQHRLMPHFQFSNQRQRSSFSLYALLYPASPTPPQGGKVFLPLLGKPLLLAPDLIVRDVLVSAHNVEVVIKNAGTAPITTAEEFWVDLYFNPNPIPTAVNQTWPFLGDTGLVWGITAPALPLDPGKSLTLTIGDSYYRADLSQFNGEITAGISIYVQVDSANANSTFGAVQETHELQDEFYNNISGPHRLPINAGSNSLPHTRLPDNNRGVLIRKR